MREYLLLWWTIVSLLGACSLLIGSSVAFSVQDARLAPPTARARSNFAARGDASSRVSARIVGSIGVTTAGVAPRRRQETCCAASLSNCRRRDVVFSLRAAPSEQKQDDDTPADSTRTTTTQQSSSTEQQPPPLSPTERILENETLGAAERAIVDAAAVAKRAVPAAGGGEKQYPVDLPSPILLATSIVLAIASTGTY